MIKVEFLNREYWVKNKWEDLTIKDGTTFCSVLPPDRLSKYYKLKVSALIKDDWKEFDTFHSTITFKEEFEDFPKYFKHVLKCFSGLPVEELNKDEIYAIYKEHLEAKVIGLLIHPIDYEAKNIESFTFKEKKYFLPVTAEMIAQSIPLKNETSGAFFDFSALEIAATGITESKFTYIASACAIFCREKDQEYDEKGLLERSDLFQDLTLDIVNEVFFCLINASNTLSRHFLEFQDQEKVKQALTGIQV